MKQHPANKALLGVLIATCSILAACGSGDDVADGDAATAPASDEAAADATAETEQSESDQATDSGSEQSEPTDESSGASAGSTADVSDTESHLGNYTLADEEFGTMVTVSIDGSTRTIVSNALPDHETGEFPNDGNPNQITAQDLTWAYTTEPIYVGNATEARTPGVAVNGVKFEPGTAETLTCSSGETYRIEALQDIYNLGLDFNNAHVQPTGEYHYHGISELLVDAYDSDDDLVHVGFAADGFLMYYSKSGAYESGYELGTTQRSGSDCVASGPDESSIDVDGTTPDGTYTSDWVFSEDNGNLDSCNGATIDGQYAYIVTDEYPFVSRCLNGEAAAEAGGGGGEAAPNGGGAAPGGDGAGGGGVPDLSEAAASLGISEQELTDALGTPPFDLQAAAETLGVTADELQAVMPPPPGG